MSLSVLREPIGSTRLRHFGVLAYLALAASLCSCANFTLHDESRASLASSAQKDYADADVTSVADADQKNLATLLAEEIKAVRTNYSLNTDFAALEIANNSSPMGRTHKEAMTRLKNIGFESIEDIRNSALSDVDRRTASRQVSEVKKVFQGLKIDLPDCEKLTATFALPDGMSDADKRAFQPVVTKYRKACDELSPPALRKGLIGFARKQWVEADDALKTDQMLVEQAKAEIAAAKAEYDRKLAEGKKPEDKAKAASETLKENAQKLSKALDKAKDLHLGVEAEERVDSLVELLTAVAGGEADPQDPHVSRAAVVAKEIPSLVESIGALEAKRTAPPVSGLLIALRRQTILADTARKRAALAAERVTILKAKYEAHYAEAVHWMHFSDAMCSYAVLSTGDEKHPGMKCNTFAAQEDGNCTLDGATISDCALKQPWNKRIRGNDKSVAKRELYKAIQHYFQALALQGVPVEQDYREIDVRHRETLLAKQSALEEWDNLVSVPIQQINGYYQGGMKPAEIADLIVKALGLTAIAIGVSN